MGPQKIMTNINLVGYNSINDIHSDLKFQNSDYNAAEQKEILKYNGRKKEKMKKNIQETAVIQYSKKGQSGLKQNQ